jgi:hypothetical protein
MLDMIFPDLPGGSSGMQIFYGFPDNIQVFRVFEMTDFKPRDQFPYPTDIVLMVPKGFLHLIDEGNFCIIA